MKWHSGEEFTANDVKFTWDTILNKAYTSPFQAAFQEVFGSPDAYKVTGRHEITVDLPRYTIQFLEWVMGAMQIMPEHGYKDIKPEQIRGHVVNTWLGSYSVKTSDGKTYTARGADRHRSLDRGRLRPGAEGLQVHARTRATGRRRPAT